MNINLNRKGIMALEGLEKQPDEALHDPAALVENDLIELSEVSAQERAQNEEVTEGEEISAAVVGISENMQSSVEEGEGISAPVAQALTAAVEHFQARLGCPVKRAFPAMESFSTNRLEATKLAIAQNRSLVTGIEKALSVAQEGFLEKIKYKFKLIFTNEQKLFKRMKEVSAAYDQKGMSEEKLTKPPFSKFFNQAGKDTVTSGDVAATVSAYYKLISNEDLHALIKKVDDALRALTTALKKTNFVADEKELQTIEALIAEVTEIENKVTAMTEGGRSFNSEADFDPLNPADKKKLIITVNEILIDNRLEKAITSLIESYYSAEAAASSMLEGMGNTSIGGAIINAAVSYGQSLKKDVQLAKKVIEKAYGILSNVGQISEANIEVCHASVTYVAMSTNKSK